MRLFRDLKPSAWFGLVLLCVLTPSVLLIAGVPAWRHAALRTAGWALVAEDPPGKAELIVISVDASESGVLEAASLVHSGFARRVALFDRPLTKAAREMSKRGARPLDLEAAAIQGLHELGVSDITVIPATVGTVDEGKVLRQWCVANSIHSVLFISTPDHSRRARRVLYRALERYGIQVIVRYARFADYDPDSWWRSRGGQRTQAIESEKLLLDMLIHPF